MKYFCMASDFKTETVDEYDRINKKYVDSKVIETFGQMAPETLFGSCRSPGGLPQVDRNQLEDYIKYCHDRGIEFNYVINATCMANEELSKAGRSKIGDFLEMLEGMGVDWITISLPPLMEIAGRVTPGLKIKASTVCQINSPHKAAFYESLGVRRIVLDEDIYRRFDILKNIRKVYTGDIEIIVNSYCMNDCPYKMFHYNSFSHSHTNRDEEGYYNSRCRRMHLGADNYLKLNWVRPEDIHCYTDAGIEYFKLQGRTNVYTGNPAKAAVHYIEERYEGNLISLLELFSEEKPFTMAGCSINNRSLDGFLDIFANQPEFCKKVCSECNYCGTFAEKAISKTDAVLLEIMRIFT